MAVVAKSVASLRVSGDTLLPTDITERLGTPPTESYRKGDVKRLSSGNEFVRKGGMWLLQAQDEEPGDLNAQVGELLSRLTPDLGVWQSLSGLYQIDLFCGLFMDDSDEGFVLAPATLAELGLRGCELQVCIYAPTREVHADDPCPCGAGERYAECCAQKT